MIVPNQYQPIDQYAKEQAGKLTVHIRRLSDIPSSADPDFKRFFKENNFENILAYFGHSIVFDSVVQEPMIMKNGILTKWSEVKECFIKLSNDGRAARNPNPPMLMPYDWQYTMDGIIERNAIKWSELKPFDKDRVDPRPGHYFVELMSKARSRINPFSRHCYLRLIDDVGNVISVGFCSRTPSCFPFRAQKAKLISPDPYEMLSGKMFCSRILIDKARYDHLKARVELDQRTQNLYFSMVTRNCSIYCCDLLNEIGVKIYNMEFPDQALRRNISYRCGCKPPKCVSIAIEWVAKFFRLLLSPITNLVMLILGASYKDADIIETERLHKLEWFKQPKKPFESCKALIDGTNFSFGTVWKVTAWQKKLEKYRKELMESITKEKTDLEARQKSALSEEQRKKFEDQLFHAKYDLPQDFFEPSQTGG